MQVQLYTSSTVYFRGKYERVELAVAFQEFKPVLHREA